MKYLRQRGREVPVMLRFRALRLRGDRRRLELHSFHLRDANLRLESHPQVRKEEAPHHVRNVLFFRMSHAKFRL